MLKLNTLDFKGVHPPRQFTYPFAYEPHPLCLLAMEHLRQQVKLHPTWEAELSLGKMVGVLVVEGGYLAAFSGTLCGQGELPCFVPPVFDLHAPNGYFQQEEAAISALNKRISRMQEAIVLPPKTELLAAEHAMELCRNTYDEGKRRRDLLRNAGTPVPPDLIRQSQHDKAELRRARKRHSQLAEQWQQQADELQTPIQALKAERALRSAKLQDWLMEQFNFLNAKGESRALKDIFAPSTPPAAAGECCAPKLLQYAYVHGLKPLCMAEFWVGLSPKSAPRAEGQAYPACQAKCRPILDWMLQGLDVEPNPLLKDYSQVVGTMRILYKDNAICLIEKPAGMLSVPGKDGLPSVQSEVQRLCPQASGPIIVHRLDMATSGLMITALTPQAYHHLQQQFARHTIIKRYRARISHALPTGQEGKIELPICPNPDDRPRQMVNKEHGRQALTTYRVVAPKDILLWPHTGRTHQLRLHLAHPQGLNNPILGDALYGQPANRLHLHADLLEFVHPSTGKPMRFELTDDPF